MNISVADLEAGKEDIQDTQVAELWKFASRESRAEAFSLRVMDFLNDPLVNALVTAVESSQDLRQAVSILLRYDKLISLDVHLTIDLTRNARIVIQKSHKVEHLPSENIDVAFGLIFRCGSLLAAKKLYPTKITLTGEKPDWADKYESYFGCPVEFGQPDNAIVFPRSLLRERVTSHNPSMGSYMERFLEEEVQRLSHSSFDLQIRSAMESFLGDTTPKLNMSKRTLQRKLESERTTFQSLLDETRVNKAKVYLLQQQKSIQEVAHLLGFSEDSSFARFFRRHTGASPRAYIKNNADERLSDLID